MFGIPSETGNSLPVTGHVKIPLTRWTFINMWYNAFRNSGSLAKASVNAGGKFDKPISEAAWFIQTRKQRVTRNKASVGMRKGKIDCKKPRNETWRFRAPVQEQPIPKLGVFFLQSRFLSGRLRFVDCRLLWFRPALFVMEIPFPWHQLSCFASYCV